MNGEDWLKRINLPIAVVLALFEAMPEKIEKHECEGCEYNQPYKHNGHYVMIMDWQKNKVIRFVDLINKSSRYSWQINP